MRLDNLGSPRKPSVSGLRGERRGKGAGGVFAVLLAETEQRGLCPDDGAPEEAPPPDEVVLYSASCIALAASIAFSWATGGASS